METTKASLVVMSHLSDVQEEVKSKDPFIGSITMRLNFAKYIILQTKGDLNQKIDADKLWEKFMKTQK